MRTGRILFFTLCFFTFTLALSKAFANETAIETAACEHLLAPVQIVRFTKPIAALKGFLTPERLAPEELEKTLEAMAKKDARGYLFKLQGLLRIYERAYEDELGDIRQGIKRDEDLIGKFTEKLDYLAFAQKVGAPQRVLRVLERDALASKERLKKNLPQIALDVAALEALVKDVDWTKPKKDTRIVVDEMTAEMEKIEAREYDMNELQTGIHEMRRNLRWFLIYFQALDGMVILQKSTGETKLNEYSYLETHPIATGPFSKIDPNPNVKHPVELPTRYFLALSKIVAELGAIKDSGENLEALASAFRRSGVAKSAHSAHKRALELASKDPKFMADITVRGKKIRSELERTKLLKRIRKSLIRGLD